jgi:hypothetical protein
MNIHEFTFFWPWMSQYWHFNKELVGNLDLGKKEKKRRHDDGNRTSVKCIGQPQNPDQHATMTALPELFLFMHYINYWLSII